jgi:hypothetical protein
MACSWQAWAANALPTDGWESSGNNFLHREHVYEPDAVVVACDGNELTDDTILQLLDVEFRKLV